METHYETLLVNKENGITTIAFNRPEKRNAMSPQLHKEMFQLLTEIRYDPETRVIVLTGTGDNFCAGQDLKQYSLEMESQPPQVRDEVREKVRRWRNEMLRTLPQPVIARITGWCLGGALTVVAGCDIALAADDAVFGLPEVNFGHFPAGDTTAMLTQHLQPKHGLYYALTGKMMSAKRRNGSVSSRWRFRVWIWTEKLPRLPNRLRKRVLWVSRRSKRPGTTVPMLRRMWRTRYPT